MAKKLKAKIQTDFDASYNVAPSTVNPAVRLRPDSRERAMDGLKWGLIPSWAKDSKFAPANARADTVAEKPFFRGALKKKRCLVPMDGFYEWDSKTKPKQPYYFYMKSGEPFVVAGLWETWTPPGKKEPLETYTLITTEANPLMAKVHDRMPVILEEADYEAWLDPETPVEQLLKLLKPYPAEKMACHAVSLEVNKPATNKPECIAEKP
jgi:putative SOS response-associated peptidase YedK